MQIKWKKQQHPGYVSPEKYNEMMPTHLPSPYPKAWRSLLIYKWQYIGYKGKKRYSIIGPSLSTHGLWEAYNGKETPRFKTLKETKAYCEAPNKF